METSSHENPGTRLLTVQQPFELASSLASGQSHRWERDGQTGSCGWHWGVIDGNLIKMRPGSGGGPSQDHYPLEIRSVPRTDAGYLEPMLRSYFRLDDDLAAIYRDITRDPQVAAMVGRYRGLRLLRLEPWECLISFVCSANSNLPRIHANVEALSQRFGQPLVLDGRIRYTFPTPEQLAEAGESTLRGLGLGFRAPSVASVTMSVAAGDLDLESLRHSPYPVAKARLMELRGVGPKIADCVLLHSLDKLEAFPIDVWVRRALGEWYFQGRKPPPDRVMLEWAQEYFGPYAGYAQLYLFHGRRLDRK